MTRNTTLLAASGLLLAGAVALVVINQQDEPVVAAPEAAPAGQARPRGERGALGGDAGAGASAGGAMAARPRPTAAYNELVAEYGEARTKLSRQVAGNVVTLLDELMALGEKAQAGGPFGRMGGMMVLGGMGRELALNDEQRAKVEELYSDFQRREMDKAKAALNGLRNKPEALMRMMLASDKFSRGEMSEDQYKQAQQTATTELQGLLNPLDRQNFQGGRPLADETFRQGMLQILDPAQAEKFNAAVAARQPDPAAPNPGALANLPPMDLEKLDRTINSAQTMTRGIQQMMEGLGGLQELNK